jgi:hypothetical protein
LLDAFDCPSIDGGAAPHHDAPSARTQQLVTLRWRITAQRLPRRSRRRYWVQASEEIACGQRQQPRNEESLGFVHHHGLAALRVPSSTGSCCGLTAPKLRFAPSRLFSWVGNGIGAAVFVVAGTG